jgi:hypothetical protein
MNTGAMLDNAQCGATRYPILVIHFSRLHHCVDVAQSVEGVNPVINHMALKGHIEQAFRRINTKRLDYEIQRLLRNPGY